MKESEIENYLVRRVKEIGGEVRKVKWIGRRNAPDRVVMIPPTLTRAFFGVARGDTTVWVELKRPGGKAAFPKDAHERAQHREHERMRAMGQRVEVIDSFEGVEELLR